MAMKRNTALYLVPIGIFCVVLLQYYYYTSDLKRIHTSEYKCIYNDNAKRTKSKLPYKTILYWTGVFGHPDFYLGFGNKIFEKCEVSNCYATDDRCHLPVDEFNAIMFHGREYSSESEDKPENRSKNQYYVYLNQESPANTPKWVGSRSFFNWTMTYRFDSDIMHPYGYYHNFSTRNNDYKIPTIEEVQRKPHKIAWMVSNCNAVSNRKDLAEKLSKYIPVDIYGACGTKVCPKEDFHGCYDLIAKNYKFYLSFENSLCSDYVTEKMYEVLKRDFVPIVYGGADYSKLAPPNSVIDVNKFGSVKELAEYIISLDKNPEKYLAYFEWKKNYVIKTDYELALCTLCKKLNQPVVHRSYSDIQNWWSSGMCIKKLPNIIFT